MGPGTPGVDALGRREAGVGSCSSIFSAPSPAFSPGSRRWLEFPTVTPPHESGGEGNAGGSG